VARDDRLLVLCGLSWAAGLIHVAAAVTHLDEYALYAIFFEALAVVQFGWGVALYRSPSRRLLVFGAVLSVLVVALWVVSRTAGLPIGPEPWRPEAVGALDALASADEALLAALTAARLRGSGRPLGHAAALGLILLSSLALAGGPVHAH
jgi:Na+-transporting methylmalonyl-CoA/oxaloacetate decarboxylase gamma subunit